jgi:K+ transporter
MKTPPQRPPTAAEEREATAGALATLTLAALGVVYGDIGTSPLYALKEVFGRPHHPVPINERTFSASCLSCSGR